MVNAFDSFFERLSHKGMRAPGLNDRGFIKRKSYGATFIACLVYVDREPMRQTISAGNIETRKSGTELRIVKTPELLALSPTQLEGGDSVIIGGELVSGVVVGGDPFTISNLIRQDDGEWIYQCK